MMHVLRNTTVNYLLYLGLQTGIGFLWINTKILEQKRIDRRKEVQVGRFL